MKNLLSKTLFISFLLSAVISSGIQAGPSTDIAAKAVVMGQIAHKGQQAISTEVVLAAAALPVILVVGVVAAKTGNIGEAVRTGDNAMKTMKIGMAITGIVMVARVTIKGIRALLMS